MKKSFSFIFFFCCSLLVFSQQKGRVQLSGIITDAKTGEPLAGASVLLVDARLGTVTDTSGRYVFKNAPTGHTLLEISFEGYKSVVEHLDINGNTVKDYSLSPSVVENEAITVTAVGSATSVRKAPIPITRVNKDQLLSAASSNIIDALSKQPGISQVTTGPAISKPVIRGLGSNRLVVINDGIRQEGQQWGDEHGIEIDENSVSRVEIVKGPASLMYGSDAIAGVVNIITGTTPPSGTIKGNILTGYGTNNRQRSFFANIGGHQKDITWGAWGDVKAAADYQNKYDGRVWNSKFNEKNFGGNIGYHGNWGFTHLIFSRFNQQLGVIEGDRLGDGSFAKLLPGGIEGKPSEGDFNSTDPWVPYQHVRHTKLISENSFRIGKGKLSAILGWQRNQRQEFGSPDAPDVYGLYFDLHTFNYNLAWHFNDKNGWNSTAGISGMWQQNRNKGDEVLIPEYNLFDIGGFIYTQKTFEKLTFSGGLRFDNRALHSMGFMDGNVQKFTDFTRSFSNFSGSAGISYSQSEELTWKLNLAHGFRAPSIPELASNGAHEGTNRYEYGVQSLHSESSWQGDLGVDVNADHVLFTASAFYNSINNFIFYRKLERISGGDSLVNGIPAYIFSQRAASLAGFEALLDLHPHPFDWLHWQNTFSYVNGRFREAIEGTKNLPLIPPARWISQLRAEINGKSKLFSKLSVYAEFDYTFAQNRPFTAFGTETATPGYALLNAGINMDIRHKDKTLFSLYLMGNNLGDVAYQNHLSRLKYTAENPVTGRVGVFNMGRNFMFRLNIPLSFL